VGRVQLSLIRGIMEQPPCVLARSTAAATLFSRGRRGGQLFLFAAYKWCSFSLPPTSGLQAGRRRARQKGRPDPNPAGREVSRAEWQAAVRQRVGKLRINIMLDAPIVEHFKALAGERGYQTIINDTLRRVIESGHLEADLRQVIREELVRR